jgi:hypothetical protein
LSDGKERELRYTLGSMRRLRKKYGKSLLDKEALLALDEETIPELIYEGLRDKDGLTDADAVADLLDTRKLKETIEKFFEAFAGAMPEKNAVSPTTVQ